MGCFSGWWVKNVLRGEGGLNFAKRIGIDFADLRAGDKSAWETGAWSSPTKSVSSGVTPQIDPGVYQQQMGKVADFPEIELFVTVAKQWLGAIARRIKLIQRTLRTTVFFRFWRIAKFGSRHR